MSKPIKLADATAEQLVKELTKRIKTDDSLVYPSCPSCTGGRGTSGTVRICPEEGLVCFCCTSCACPS